MSHVKEISNVRVLRNGSMQRPVEDIVRSKRAQRLFKLMDGLIEKAEPHSKRPPVPREGAEILPKR